MTQYFSLQDLTLRITCSEAIANVVVPILDYHGFHPATTPSGDAKDDWTVVIEARAAVDPVPVGAVAAGGHDSGLSVYRLPDTTVLHGEPARAEVAAAGRRLDVQLTHELIAETEELNFVLYFIITFALLALLQRKSLYAIHGAAVCKGESNGVLFVGYSDTGKSTMTMALVRRGWEYLSDDSIFVRDAGKQVEALPFRRDFGLDPDSDHYFPELRGHESTQMTDIDKWRVNVHQLYPSQGRERCVPRVIIFPQISDVSSSSLEDIGQAEALVLLMRQCSFIDTDKELASAQMKTLQSLVRQASVHKLVAGRDLKEDPGRVEDLLLPLLGIEE
ncbi:MAG: hypothetical protein HKN13_01770 [Rhodothermales bacterium]|nr:hypothetical protein [Rhodothermales bacterium]